MSISIEAPASRLLPRKRRGRPERPEPREVSDVGPLIQRQRGDLKVDFAADPANPNATIRRAMRNPRYNQMHLKREINDEEREACDAYAILIETRGGARWVNGEHVGGSSTNPAYRGHPTMTQVQASARIGRAHTAVGNDAAALLELFVVQNLPLVELAKRRKERDEVTKGRLLAAINRLAEHWGMIEHPVENTR